MPGAASTRSGCAVYRRRRPERTYLYQASWATWMFFEVAKEQRPAACLGPVKVVAALESSYNFG
jgi:hypothetical protein